MVNNVEINNKVLLWRQTILPSLSLFTSVGTLLCCTLPALLVIFGMGAALAGFVAAAPWVTVVSDYKGFMFVIAGILLVLAAWMQWRARHAPCSADLLKAKACARLRVISWVVLGFSGLVYITGFFFAFIAVYVVY